MKIFSNLPGNLRALFTFLRISTLVIATFWLLNFTFNVWIQKRYVDDPKVIITWGEGWLQTAPHAVGLKSEGSTAESLGLINLRGSLQENLCGKDAALVSAVRWSAIPALVVATGFLWSLFGSLRGLCANVERGEVFSEGNLFLIRRIGWIFVANSLVGFAASYWAGHVMGGYLRQHVALTGIKTDPVYFTLPSGTLPYAGLDGLLIGCLVLMLSEAFRQGLALKSENDLTV
jgi:Protein of unknown function (DUF2975)